jgi:lysylphosphatidylglycerol synthetase-like protein (DUF2156 family)
MKSRSLHKPKPTREHQFQVLMTSLLVAVYGLYIIADTLINNIVRHHHHQYHITSLTIDLPLLIGLSVIYLGILLRRRKRTAWLVTIMAYTFYLGYGVSMIASRIGDHSYLWSEIIRVLVLPIIIILLLIKLRQQFVVKSDTQSFRFSLRFIVIFLLVILNQISTGKLASPRHFTILLISSILLQQHRLGPTLNAPICSLTHYLLSVL